MDSNWFASLKLSLLSGKGGVGKTTIACGWARQWASQFPHERVLLISTDPAHSLGDVLQMEIGDKPVQMLDRPNLQARSLDAKALFREFKLRYGDVLELLAERGSFISREDLSPVWDLGLPGLDELMGLLEIQRLLREHVCDRIVVDMAPSGHTLNLFGLMDFLDELLAALELFQAKHHTIQHSFTGKVVTDEADEFLQTLKADLTAGRQLLQHSTETACIVVAIAESMSLLETDRLITALHQLRIPVGGVVVNRVETAAENTQAEDLTRDRLAEQSIMLSKFLTLTKQMPLFILPQQQQEPVGNAAIDQLTSQMQQVTTVQSLAATAPVWKPEKIAPGLADFVKIGRRLVLVGGKGGVGKTTIAAAIGLSMATLHPKARIRVVSIDPAHSLGDAFGHWLSHEPQPLTANLTGQEMDSDRLLEQFRADYLWELAAMMSGESGDQDATLQIAYGPEAWRKIVAQALPGVDELLALIEVMELLEANTQDLIVLDTAPTGHLLRFLEMPTTLADWLAWIFKLWLKYQDVIGRTEFMGRLRSLRQRVIRAQKLLKDPNCTEFIGVVQAQSAIIAEAQRLTHTLDQIGIAQRYIVHNRCSPTDDSLKTQFPHQAIVRLPNLPRCIEPLERIQLAADSLF
jgi:arsenite/tail-anchored protein-transporting ATPase